MQARKTHYLGIDDFAAMALNPWADQCTGRAFNAKNNFMAVGNITTTVNKGRRARQMGSLFL